MRRKRWLAAILAAGTACTALFGCGSRQIVGTEMARSGESPEKELQAWEEAKNTPYGKYPELITYTLGKMIGGNRSNMPERDTYEDNVYTRYLRECLNIQNKDVFEAMEDQYTANVDMAIASGELPDVMVIEDRETLIRLAEEGMIADLSEALENCASDGIKAMYDSYEVSALDSAMIDGRLMALPEPSFGDGPNLLWLRRDWMDKLGLEAPDTMGEAVEIIRAFVEQDPGNNGEGNTIGLVCHSDLTGETGYRYEFQLNTIFASYNAFPKQWILQEDGTVVYGSVQPQIKEALAGVRKLYEEKLLDDSFMLRTMTNIAELIIDGKCGSFFGPWWAPNNPLMEAMEKNPDAVWEPYLIRTTEDGKLQYYDQNPSYKYVVVRKDFEHPEIVFKMASVMFDKMRTEGQDNEELAYYFQTNVDSTARPISINIDYSDALHRCYEDINAALTGKKDPDELQVLEYAYYVKCKDYLDHSQSADAETWAAYESRIRACALLDNKDLEVCSTAFSGETETMKTKWAKLQEMETKLYLEVITGVKDLDEFDRFVEEWMEAGGEQITLEVTEAVREAKGACAKIKYGKKERCQWR